MSEKVIPFYTQAALLDRYIHSDNPNSDPDIVKIIISILSTKEELRNYFFRSGPSAAWARILWENGFLSESPEIEKTESDYRIKLWDVQYYLISIASQVPEIVLLHVEALKGHGLYLARAIEALCKIPVEYSEKAIPTVLTWLSNPETAEIATQEALALISLMAKEGRTESALNLFDILSSERNETHSYRASDTYRDIYGFGYNRSDTFETLKKQSPFELINILEKHLLKSLESRDTSTKKAHGGAMQLKILNKIILTSTRTTFFVRLRDTLLMVIEKNLKKCDEIVNRYLHEGIVILRRLGLYIISVYPVKFRNDIVRELLDQKNLDDLTIHHEFFLLLRRGFTELREPEKKLLVKMIMDGPSLEQAERIYESYRKVDFPNREKYLSNWKKGWIRDRLWMIKDQLDVEAKSILNNLVEEGGRPEHPDFLAWSSGAFWIADVSPYSELELSKFTPDQLYEFIKSWSARSERTIRSGTDFLQRFG